MKIIKLFSFVLSVLILTSCELTEEITIKENGSGTYDFKIDMSGMMSMAGALKDSTDVSAPEKVDTIVNMKDLIDINGEKYNNLSASDKATYDSLKDMKLKMKMDEEAGVSVVNFLIDFNSVSDLVDMQRKVEMAQNIQGNSEEEPDPTNQKVTYLFSKKQFSRNVEILKLDEEQQAKFDEAKSQAVMFSDSPYKIKYHFPNKIKSTSLEGAVISEDGKTFTYETTLGKVLDDPKSLDFVIKF